MPSARSALQHKYPLSAGYPVSSLTGGKRPLSRCLRSGIIYKALPRGLLFGIIYKTQPEPGTSYSPSSFCWLLDHISLYGMSSSSPATLFLDLDWQQNWFAWGTVSSIQTPKKYKLINSARWKIACSLKLCNMWHLHACLHKINYARTQIAREYLGSQFRTLWLTYYNNNKSARNPLKLIDFTYFKYSLCYAYQNRKKLIDLYLHFALFGLASQHK